MIDDDFLDFLTLSTELLYAEILTKFIVCVYEALWIMSGNAQPGGGTPGKKCMGLRVLLVEAVVSIQNSERAQTNNTDRVIIFPAQNIGFQRALLRSLVKNVLMTLVFPMCFIMYPNNRTSYDVATQTIVVETAGERQPAWRPLF